MRRYSICKSNARKEYREIATVRAISPNKAVKQFMRGRGKVQPIKGRIYHVVLNGLHKLKFKA